MSLFYIDIRFSSSDNKGYSIDTQFCTHDLIKENDLNDHPCTLRIILALHASICLCVTCINSVITDHKNDLEILMVITMFSVFKSDHRIKR